MYLWTDERIEALKTMWGTVSAGEIAAELGAKSKSAVIGKAHRLGLPKCRNGRKRKTRPSPNLRAAHLELAARSAPVKTAIAKSGLSKGDWIAQKISEGPAPAPSLPPPAPVVGRKTFSELERYDCKFPVGTDPATMLFCAEPTAAGMPYCARCCRIAFQPRDHQQNARRAGANGGRP